MIEKRFPNYLMSKQEIIDCFFNKRFPRLFQLLNVPENRDYASHDFPIYYEHFDDLDEEERHYFDSIYILIDEEINSEKYYCSLYQAVYYEESPIAESIVLTDTITLTGVDYHLLNNLIKSTTFKETNRSTSPPIFLDNGEKKVEKYVDSLKSYFLSQSTFFEPKGMTTKLKINFGVIFIISCLFGLFSIQIGILTFFISYYFYIRKQKNSYGCRYFKDRQTGNAVTHVACLSLSNKETPISIIENLFTERKFDELISYFSQDKVEIKNNIQLEISEDKKSKKQYLLLRRQRAPTHFNHRESEGLTEVAIVEGKDYELLFNALNYF